jgi:hypothetical protein
VREEGSQSSTKCVDVTVTFSPNHRLLV